MKNYYEILEVSPNASKEIIDKVYKTLAKKYHPDANSKEKKEWAEEEFKKINEAYEVLSDKEKRANYDNELKKEIEANDESLKNLKIMYEEMEKQNKYLKNEIINLKNNKRIEDKNTQNNMNSSQAKMYDNYYQEINSTINRAYHDAYIQRMKDYGYKIVYKKSLKDRIKDFISIFITMVVIFIIMLLLWQIPAVRDYIKSVFFWMK